MTAARILMIATPVPTHFTPLVPLAWALRALGHDVLVLGQPDIVPAVRSAGLHAVTAGEPFGIEGYLRSRLRGDQRPLASFPRPAPERMGMFARVWAAHARQMLPEYLRLAGTLRPDLIVADQMEYTALLVGGALGVPVVHHRWGVDGLSGPALAEARTLLADLAEDGLPEPDQVLDPCPATLQTPTAAAGTPIRFVAFNGSGALPGWTLAGRPPDGTRRVAVSLGSRTLTLNGVPFVRALLHALGGAAGVEIVATVEAAHREALGTLPATVRLVDPTPLQSFLGSCDAVVHHGGAGTTMTATAFGLPQLVLPQLSDTFVTGDRLRETGAGLSLDTLEAQDDPVRIRAALRELLDDPAARKAAGLLATEIAAMPPPARVAADLIHTHVTRGRKP